MPKISSARDKRGVFRAPTSPTRGESVGASRFAHTTFKVRSGPDRHVTAARNHADKKRPRAAGGPDGAPMLGACKKRPSSSVLTFLALLGDGGGRQQAEDDEGDDRQGGGRPAASRRRGGRAPGHRRHVRRVLNAPHQPTRPAASRSAYSPPHPRRRRDA